MPRVSPLNSQVAFCSQASGIIFNIAGVSEGFHGPCPDLVSFPARSLFLSAFRWISFGESQIAFDFARIARTVLRAGAKRSDTVVRITRYIVRHRSAADCPISDAISLSARLSRLKVWSIAAISAEYGSRRSRNGGDNGCGEAPQRSIWSHGL